MRPTLGTQYARSAPGRAWRFTRARFCLERGRAGVQAPHVCAFNKSRKTDCSMYELELLGAPRPGYLAGRDRSAYGDRSRVPLPRPVVSIHPRDDNGKLRVNLDRKAFSDIEVNLRADAPASN